MHYRNHFTSAIFQLDQTNTREELEETHIETKIAEGWSVPSDSRGDDTESLQPKPAKPDPPLIEVCTFTKVNLTVQVPQNTCSISSPIIKWKLSGSTADEKEIIKYYPVDENDFTKQSMVLPVTYLDPKKQYILQLSAKNENGWSEPSIKFKIDIAVLSIPKNVRISSLRKHSLLKIRWKAPGSILITHYEIRKRAEKNHFNDLNIVKASANKFSATFNKLKQNTYYYFKIRSCHGHNVSAWSEEIKANTRMHIGIKVAFAPALCAISTVAFPISTAALLGVLFANKPTSSKATVAAATAAGAAIGTLGLPIVSGALCTYAFVNGIDPLSDQSDDEDPVEAETEF